MMMSLGMSGPTPHSFSFFSFLFGFFFLLFLFFSFLFFLLLPLPVQLILLLLPSPLFTPHSSTKPELVVVTHTLPPPLDALPYHKCNPAIHMLEESLMLLESQIFQPTASLAISLSSNFLAKPPFLMISTS